MPKVSIIISIYNVREYMKASVESALNQTEKDIEILLVDDGSTDGSGQLCDEYAAKDDRIRVIHKANGGLSSARNVGVASAAANYVMLLDGDDYIHSMTAGRVLSVIESYPSDVVQFYYQEVDKEITLPDLSNIEVIFQSHTPSEAFEKLYECGGVYASACTKLFRKQLLIEIPFENIRHEDEMWCTRAFPKGLTITYIPDVLYGYVMREGSIIHSNFQDSRFDILTIKNARIAVLHDLGLYEFENHERNTIFQSLFTIYKDAKMNNNVNAQNKVLQYFKENAVVDNVKIGGRMRAFHFIAKLYLKGALDLYYKYWSLKDNAGNN